MVLILGWAGFLQSQFGWYANLVFFSTCTLIFLPRFISAKAARAAMWLLLALGTNVLFWRGLSRVEIDGYDPITAYGPGYYAWLLVMLAMILLLWHRQYIFVEEQSE